MNFHKRILIGSIFIFLDFNLGWIDILPDFVGFIIAATAFSNLKWKYAQLGFNLSLTLSALSLVQVFFPQPTDMLMMTDYNWTAELIGLAYGVFSLFYFASVFAVSKQILSGETSRFPSFFIGVQLLSLLWPVLFLHSSLSVAEPLGIILIVLTVIALIGYFIFFWRRKNMEQELIEESRGPLVISPQ